MQNELGSPVELQKSGRYEMEPLLIVTLFGGIGFVISLVVMIGVSQQFTKELVESV